MSTETPDFASRTTQKTGILDVEYTTYQAHKKSLVKNSLGKHVLVKDEVVWGTYDNFQDAYKVGLNLFGNVPMLITEVREIEPVIVINALAAA